MSDYKSTIKVDYLQDSRVAIIDSESNLNTSTVTTNELLNVKKININGDGSNFLSDDGTYKKLGDVDISDIVNELILESDKRKYPIGKLEFNTTGVNPNSYLGFGTWVLWGQGRVPVCVASDGIFAGAETEVGSETVTLTEEQMPVHTHTQEAHTHTFKGVALSNHTHTFTGTAHTHTLNSHTHTVAAHNHTFSGTTSSTAHSHNLYHSGRILYWDAGLPNYPDKFALGTNYNTTNVQSTWDARTANDGSHTHTYSGTTSTKAQFNTGAASGNTSSSTATGTNSSVSAGTPSGTNSSVAPTINSAGGGASHSNVQPSITCYIWKRTA